MSVLQSVKEAIGIESNDPDVRCEECGYEFKHSGDIGSYWFSCPECGNETESEFTSIS